MSNDKKTYADKKLQMAKEKAELNQLERDLRKLAQKAAPKTTAIIALLLFVTAAVAQAPNLHAELMQPDPQPAKTLFIFNSPKQARTWTTVAGYALMATGGYLSGKAEMKSRYYGTTRNWDSYHITRDAGLMVTGLSCVSLGASITIGERPRLLDIAWKLGSGLIIYKIASEATYHLTAPAR